MTAQDKKNPRRVQPTGAMKGSIMQDLIPFTYEGTAVRVLDIEGEPWAVLNDLCAVLDITNTRNVAARLEEADVRQADIRSGGQTRSMNVVNEPGMYEVIIRSDSPKAKPFRRWLTTDVLPSIRRTGSYGAPSMDITTLDGISAILDAGKAALNRAQAAEARALALEGPAAERDLYRSSEGLQLIGDVANRFKAYAASRFPDMPVKHEDVWDHAGRLGIVIRGNTVRHNQPTSQAVEAGWATVAETLVETNRHGTVRKVTPRLTPKGEARLWDGLTTYALAHGTLTITKEIAA